MTTDLDDADALVKKLWKTQAALSRAEETIEKVRRSIPSENPELIEAGYAVPAEDLLGIIATYDQQT